MGETTWHALGGFVIIFQFTHYYYANIGGTLFDTLLPLGRHCFAGRAQPIIEHVAIHATIMHTPSHHTPCTQQVPLLYCGQTGGARCQLLTTFPRPVDAARVGIGWTLFHCYLELRTTAFTLTSFCC